MKRINVTVVTIKSLSVLFATIWLLLFISTIVNAQTNIATQNFESSGSMPGSSTYTSSGNPTWFWQPSSSGAPSVDTTGTPFTTISSSNSYQGGTTGTNCLSVPVSSTNGGVAWNSPDGNNGNVQVWCVFKYTSGANFFLFSREQDTSSVNRDCYALQITNSSVKLVNRKTGTGTTMGSSVSTTLTAGVYYYAEMDTFGGTTPSFFCIIQEITGSNPGYFMNGSGSFISGSYPSVKCLNNVTDNSGNPAYTTAGRAGVGWSTTSGQTLFVDNITINQYPQVTAGNFSTITKTSTNDTLTWTSATSGTSPYTYTLKTSTDPNFVTGVTTLLSGSSALTYTDNYDGQSAGTLVYYQLVATDANSNTATYQYVVPSGTYNYMPVNFDSYNSAGQLTTELYEPLNVVPTDVVDRSFLMQPSVTAETQFPSGVGMWLAGGYCKTTPTTAGVNGEFSSSGEVGTGFNTGALSLPYTTQNLFWDSGTASGFVATSTSADCAESIPIEGIFNPNEFTMEIPFHMLTAQSTLPLSSNFLCSFINGNDYIETWMTNTQIKFSINNQQVYPTQTVTVTLTTNLANGTDGVVTAIYDGTNIQLFLTTLKSGTVASSTAAVSPIPMIGGDDLNYAGLYLLGNNSNATTGFAVGRVRILGHARTFYTNSGSPFGVKSSLSPTITVDPTTGLSSPINAGAAGTQNRLNGQSAFTRFQPGIIRLNLASGWIPLANSALTGYVACHYETGLYMDPRPLDHNANYFKNQGCAVDFSIAGSNTYFSNGAVGNYGSTGTAPYDELDCRIGGAGQSSAFVNIPGYSDQDQANIYADMIYRMIHTDGYSVGPSGAAPNITWFDGPYNEPNYKVQDLQTNGTEDWEHWGNGGVPGRDHKSSTSGGTISDYTGTGTISNFTTDITRTLKWGSGGTPNASNTGIGSCVYTTGVGNGFTLTATSDTTIRKLVVYVGGNTSSSDAAVSCTFTASLSDASVSADHWTGIGAVQDSDTFGTATINLPVFTRCYIINYKSHGASQTLNVSWKVASGSGKITLMGAYLTTGSITNGNNIQVLAADSDSYDQIGAAFQWAVAQKTLSAIWPTLKFAGLTEADEFFMSGNGQNTFSYFMALANAGIIPIPDGYSWHTYKGDTAEFSKSRAWMTSQASTYPNLNFTNMYLCMNEGNLDPIAYFGTGAAFYPFVNHDIMKSGWYITNQATFVSEAQRNNVAFYTPFNADGGNGAGSYVQGCMSLRDGTLTGLANAWTLWEGMAAACSGNERSVTISGTPVFAHAGIDASGNNLYVYLINNKWRKNSPTTITVAVPSGQASTWAWSTVTRTVVNDLMGNYYMRYDGSDSMSIGNAAPPLIDSTGKAVITMMPGEVCRLRFNKNSLIPSGARNVTYAPTWTPSLTVTPYYNGNSITFNLCTDANFKEYRVYRDNILWWYGPSIPTNSSPLTDNGVYGEGITTAHTYELRAVDIYGNETAASTYVVSNASPGVTVNSTPPAAPVVTAWLSTTNQYLVWPSVTTDNSGNPVKDVIRYVATESNSGKTYEIFAPTHYLHWAKSQAGSSFSWTVKAYNSSGTASANSNTCSFTIPSGTDGSGAPIVLRENTTFINSSSTPTYYVQDTVPPVVTLNTPTLGTGGGLISWTVNSAPFQIANQNTIQGISNGTGITGFLITRFDTNTSTTVTLNNGQLINGFLTSFNDTGPLSSGHTYTYTIYPYSFDTSGGEIPIFSAIPSSVTVTIGARRESGHPRAGSRTPH